MLLLTARISPEKQVLFDKRVHPSGSIGRALQIGLLVLWTFLDALLLFFEEQSFPRLEFRRVLRRLRVWRED